MYGLFYYFKIPSERSSFGPSPPEESAFPNSRHPPLRRKGGVDKEAPLPYFAALGKAGVLPSGPRIGAALPPWGSRGKEVPPRGGK